jgi:hypothetical protein
MTIEEELDRIGWPIIYRCARCHTVWKQEATRDEYLEWRQSGAKVEAKICSPCRARIGKGAG